LRRFHPRAEHVLLHRIWLFTSLQNELTLEEHVHIIECEHCRVALRASVDAESFGGLLKELGREDEGQTGTDS
jgi:hypothetical protein